MGRNGYDICILFNIRENTIFGNVYSARVANHPHTPYLKAVFSVPSKYYRILGNDRTQNFVREQKTRYMVRNIILNCDNNSSTSVSYHFKIKFQDMTPVSNRKICKLKQKCINF